MTVTTDLSKTGILPAQVTQGYGTNSPERLVYATNRRGLFKLQAAIRDIYEGTARQAKILVIGDSVSGDISLPMVMPLWNAVGNAGWQASNGATQYGVSITLAGGAAASAGAAYTTWITGAWTDLPSAATMTYAAAAETTNYPRVSITGVRIHYLTSVGGGTFKVQEELASVWTDLGAVIDTNAAAGFVSTTLATSGTDTATRIRLLGVSGTCAIISVSFDNATGMKYFGDTSVGGSILGNYMLASSAMWDAYLAAIAPDLIFVYFKDDVDATYTTALGTLQARIYANCPQADVIYVGPTNSSISDPGGGATTIQSDVTNRAAIKAHVDGITNMRAYYWNAYDVWGTYAVGNALGLYTDTTHPNDKGRQVLSAAFCRDFAVFQSLGVNSPNRVNSSAITRGGGFLAAGGAITGLTRVSNTGDLQSSAAESADATAAFRVAGAIHAAKAIRSDIGLAVGADLGNGTITTSKTLAASSAWTGIAFTLSTSGHSSSGSNAWAGYSALVQVNHGGSATNTGTIKGGAFQVKESGSGTGNLTSVYGVHAITELSGAHPVTNSYGVMSDVSSYGSGNVGTMYGYALTTFKGGTSVVTTAYGYHIPSNWDLQASTVWGFYCAANVRSYFAGGITNKPRSSVTLAANGEYEVEATANTTLTFKLRGSDGTTRSATLTLA